MAKRKMSTKQKAALAKGRAALARKRGKKSVRKVAKRKATKRKTRKLASAEHVDTIAPIFINSEKRTRKMKRRKTVSKVKVRRRKSSGRRFYGFDVKGPMELIKDGTVAAIGGVGGSFIANRIPVAANIKPLIPVALGAVLGSTKLGRNPMVKAAAMGMIVAGALSLARQYAPQIALLAGEEDVDLYGIPTLGEDIPALTDETDDTDLYGIPTLGTEAFVNSSDI